MLRKKIFLTLFFCLLSGLFLAGLNIDYSHAQLKTLENLDQAGDAVYGSADAGQMREPNYVISVVGRIINVFLSVLGVIFLILLIYSGARWMMAGGNEESITKAKQTIYRAIIGLLIIAASYGISSFVVSNIVASTK
ncbi:hypothetical protein A2316_01215 [Candidatus Falkowbacteria bacterium RIFOXYB2_FULL_38_15]|uniref:Uncharacterized protein n=1 Tax=Candidatus Falkowbacteria bacterium RIFOXYA2_FULL_38_12 TaxID=1797993 RepID=A0A1F5S4S2_9BACT|nr:MAG: hypothetical protein A2257_02615 [Candidatus Falkowbacteria bacterium RIFOXYA2_FULL_38_12]OGF32800.1 MAG: hypothetical protein A2316_01215 [Candidatus Falkowbacteria bacterium RIFOXYB2_FULL_38_15]OGF42163.1 MAG: hypothetical protein A2555_02675 [Candidatus Falkowbacteria bacterium RIFOXYD2_FULL_39_16]